MHVSINLLNAAENNALVTLFYSHACIENLEKESIYYREAA